MLALNKLLLIPLALLPIVVQVRSDCQNTPWTDTPYPSCPEGLVVAYWQMSTNNRFTARCCPPGSVDYNSEILYTANCRPSNCQEKGSTNLCQFGDGMSYLFFRNDYTQVNYVETVTDSCKMGTGKVGVNAMCCEANSTDTLLTTLYGAERHEFPHFVRMDDEGCGATIYNERYILTASHCVISGSTYQLDRNSAKKVRIDILIDDAYTVHEYEVEDIFYHEKTSQTKPPDEYGSIYYDVAILKLKKPIQFGEHVKALPLPPRGFIPDKYANHGVIVGFGKSDTTRQYRKLQKANVLLRSNKRVFVDDYKLGNYLPYKDQLIAAGGIVDGVISPIVGQGDSGGPLICKGPDGNAVLCGIVSAARPVESCLTVMDETCLPSIFASTDYFRDWIENIAGDQSKAVLLKQPLYGVPAPASKYLHQVHITSKEGHSCGGTLIQNDILITAAHCVVKPGSQKTYSSLKIVVGLRNLTMGGGKEYFMKSPAMLPGYALGGGGQRRKRVVSLVLEANNQSLPNAPMVVDDAYYINDIVVVKLKQKVDIPDSDLPRLAKPYENLGDKAMEISFPRNTTLSGALSQREFQILQDPDCQQRLDNLSPLGLHIKLDQYMMCGVEKYSGGSLCDRELGGGLICTGPQGEDVLCGVQIFRTCEYNVPNGFIDVRKLSGWISQAIDALNQ